MAKKKNLDKEVKITRSSFLLWLFPLFSAFAIVFPFSFLYRIFNFKVNFGWHKKRKYYSCNPDKETLIVNNKEKTNKESKKAKVMHYPLFIYTLLSIQNCRLPNKRELISITSWRDYHGKGYLFTKSMSGLIFERLALGELKSISEKSLDNAIEFLALAFTKAYIKSNIYSYRLYDLLIQCIALRYKSPSESWKKFKNILNNAEIKEERLAKGKRWITSEDQFSKKVNYIGNAADSYKLRIQKRANE